MTELTGKHVLAITVSAFAVIIAVNLTLAFKAVSTFPGLEVDNSYVASQGFNKRKAAQEALGWTVAARTEGAELIVAIVDKSGAPVRAAQIDGIFGRATETRDDQIPAFTFDGSVYRASIALALGNWDFWIKAVAEDGTPFQQRMNVTIGG